MQKKIYLTGALLVALSSGASANSPYISKVFEYSPAPGQYVNELPEYAEGDDAATMARKAGEQLIGAATPGMITLGAYGGYVIFGFDHPVVNLHGRYDFQVYGNALPGSNTSAEPGVVSVSVDANGNGLPDDEWYQLAGSDYSLPSTMHQSSIVYCRPSADHVAVPDPADKSIVDAEYIAYTAIPYLDAIPESGFLHKVSFHSQSYWPEWMGSTIHFEGERLASNAEDVSGNGKRWETHPLNWGYADNLPNAEYRGFSIDWAVDAEGRGVNLQQIDFVRVHTGILQNLGWLGEESTEVSGAEDLHPDAVYSPSWPSDPIDPAAEYGSPTGIAMTEASAQATSDIYDLQGHCILHNADYQQILDLPRGIYIQLTQGKAKKILKK